MILGEELDKNKNIESAVLAFLDNNDNPEEDYQHLSKIIDEYQICADKHDFALFMHLISTISENYHRGPDFFSKLERILRNYEKDIRQNLTNSEIFNIFKDSKRILLFLIEEKLIIFNRKIVETIIRKKYRNAKYPQYFSPEIKPFMKEKWFPQYDGNPYHHEQRCNVWVKDVGNELPQNFNELRKKGENESYICELIRKDSIDDFIIFVNKNNYSLQSKITASIYETNSFLLKKQTEPISHHDMFYKNAKPNDNKLTLIEYATFFGSIQIF